MVTKMGNFQIRSVLFVLKTTPLSKPEFGGELNVAAQSSGNLFGDPYRPSGGFLGSPDQSCQNNDGGFYDKLTPQSKFVASEPAVNTSSWWSQPGTNIAGYVQNLKDQREPCLYMEKDHNMATGYQHYQSLPFNAPYEGLSFEEIHLADLKAGRMGPSQTSGNPFPTNVSLSTLGGGDLFGRPADYQGLASQSFKPAVGLFGSVRPAAPGGLIGGFSNHNSAPPALRTATQTTTSFSGDISAQSIAVRPGTGFFGSPGTQTVGAPTGSGLFGGVHIPGTTGGAFGGFGTSSTAGAPSSDPFGNLRGLNSSLPSSGLFGSTQTTNTGGLFGTSGVPASIPTSTGVSNTTQTVPTGSLFGSFGSANYIPSVPNLFNSTQPPPPANGLFGSVSSTSNLPIRPSLFGSAAPLPNTPRPTNPFAGFRSTTRPGPSTDIAQSNERPLGAPKPFSNATATFRPVFGTTSTTTVTSPLNPFASNFRPPISVSAQQGRVQAT
jgi:hypothetical protein